ncbi:alpha/beta fold hydrolase [Micromonospora sp. NPDC048999]|uniref:alpha/beta fold hydrolase n=1 Tax=Micromonospora sp. NPDC048999 TaxID=3155391 RepID=UPI0033D5DEF5
MLAEPTMVLVHSPLLTSATWDALRPHLEAAGWRVAVPDLRPLVEAPSFHAAVCAAAAASVAPGAPIVVVGHSRAGPYLPGIANAIGTDRLDVVFLDARLPHPGTSWIGSLPPERAAWLREIAVSGRLPTWDTWFPTSSLGDLLPDPGQRRQVLHGLPELPWKIVSEVLPTPGSPWHSARRIYLQLSAAYQSTAEQAEECGYRVRRVDADHLAMVTQPTMVTDLLLSALRA